MKFQADNLPFPSRNGRSQKGVFPGRFMRKPEEYP